MEDFAILITSSHGSSPNKAAPGQGWNGYRLKNWISRVDCRKGLGAIGIENCICWDPWNL